MTETTVNIPLLRKAVEWAEAEAAKPIELCEWDQAAYRVRPDEFENEYGIAVKAPECGTCFCLAGFVTSQIDPTYEKDAEYDSDAHETAADALALTTSQADRLFNGGNSIADVRRIAESIAGERL